MLGDLKSDKTPIHTPPPPLGVFYNWDSPFIVKLLHFNYYLSKKKIASKFLTRLLKIFLKLATSLNTLNNYRNNKNIDG